MADPISLAELASCFFSTVQWIASRTGTFYANQKSSKRFCDRMTFVGPRLRAIAAKSNPTDAEHINESLDLVEVGPPAPEGRFPGAVVAFAASPRTPEPQKTSSRTGLPSRRPTPC